MTARNACANVADLLPAYAAGVLTPEATQAVTDHLGRCPACRERLREWQLIVAAAHTAASGPSPSPDVLDRVRTSIEAHPVSRRRSRPNLWHRMTGGHRQGWPHPSAGAQVDPGHDRHPGYPAKPARSTIAEISVIAVVVILGGGLIGRDWWAHNAGQESPATQVQPATRPPTQPPPTGELSFTSLLSIETTHPGANLRLGRLTMEPGSSTGLAAEDGSKILMVEAGIISGLVDGPATVTHGAGCERAGQTEELDTGEHFELQASDHMLIPAGTSSELDNEEQDAAQALHLRIQAPGPPPRFTNGVEYRQLVQVPARDLPPGPLQFSLREGGLSPGAVHEIDGPGVLYVEAGTFEIAETNADLDIEGDDDLEDDDALDRDDSGADERIALGGWFFLDEGEHATLTVPDRAAYLELRFEHRDTEDDP